MGESERQVPRSGGNARTLPLVRHHDRLSNSARREYRHSQLLLLMPPVGQRVLPVPGRARR